MGTTAPWRQLLLSALESNAHLKHSSYFQLATIGTNGRPSNRTVVFRGFHDNSDKIQMNTDGRTRKIEELNRCSFAEICWYFTDSWEQFRISGEVDIINGLNPDPIKLQCINFKCSKERNPGLPVQSNQGCSIWGPNPGLPLLGEQTQPTMSLDPSTGPVDTFILLILDPDQVDYLNLKSNQRLTFKSRVTATKEKSWIMEKVNL